MIVNPKFILFLVLLVTLLAVPFQDYNPVVNRTTGSKKEGFIRTESLTPLNPRTNQAVSISNKDFPPLHQPNYYSSIPPLHSDINLNLTEEEKAYLSQIDFIPICIDPDWMPYEKLDEEGNYVGLVADYIKIISQRIGKEFRVIKTSSWDESLSIARQRGCDLLPGAVPTPSRQEFLNFSEPYIFLPLVVATNLDEIFILNFEQVSHQRFALIKGYAAIELLSKNYPDIAIETVPDARTGLTMVRRNKVYGYIDTLPTISYQLKTNKMPNLKISGELDLNYDVSIAVRNDRPLLLSILNKAIDTISDEERQKIFYYWISVNYDQGFNYVLFSKILAFFLGILFFLLYRNLIVSRYNKKLIEVNNKLDFLYKIDKLTGLFNRHFIDETLEKEVNKTNNYNLACSLSIVLLDVDHFKRINDTYGHHIGDSVLVEVAVILKNNLRKTDLVGRWGGEEFIVVCPETELSEAANLAEKLRHKISEHHFLEVEKAITASFGVSTCKVDDTVQSLIKRVDDALYFSKRNNRNCVTIRD
jgi:polar amino acid transport system substrate-binding protein